MEEKKQKQQKSGAKISLIVLLLSIGTQFVSIYQTNYQLVSPLIPKDTIWEISKQFVFTAFFFTVSCLVALVLYFYEKYLWVIIFTVIVLIAGRYIYLPLL